MFVGVGWRCFYSLGFHLIFCTSPLLPSCRCEVLLDFRPYVAMMVLQISKCFGLYFFLVLFVWLLMCMFRCSFDVIVFRCFFACFFVCALDAYAFFIWMLCLYVFVCLFVCILLHLVVWYHCVKNWQKQNCFGFLTIFW